jgi:Sec-independent protein translocase protein TatA
MPSLGLSELLVVSVVLLALVGPQRLAGITRPLGTWFRSVREALLGDDADDFDDDDDEDWSIEEIVPLVLLAILIPVTIFVWAT